MKRLFSLFTSLISMALLTACDSLVKEVDPSRTPSTESQFVVNAYISPQDTVLAVLVTRSRPVFGPSANIDPQTVSNVAVTLSDGSRSVPLPFSEKDGFHRADARLLPIGAGQTYTLTVTAPGGERLTARTTVPQPVPLEEVKLDSTENTNRFGPGGYSFFLQAFWRDAPGVKNYYRLAGNLFYTQRYTTGQPPREQSVNNVTSFGFGNGGLVTDENRDGTRISSRRQQIYLPSMSVNGQPPTFPSPVSYIIYLLNVDENYYRYHESAERQDNVNDNPFAEPVLVQGNIEGGLGCFGSYNRTNFSGRLR